MPKLSIIIPVYNAEKYLSRCIDSILAQPYKDWELLLVDDGSQDNSRAVCERYCSTEFTPPHCIRLIHKQNGGVSSARNAGLEQAIGEYVTFVDADDWLEPNTITKQLFDENFDIVKIPRNRGSRYKVYCEDVFLRTHKQVWKFAATDYNHECWGKFYRRGVIGENRFRTDLRMGEDVLFIAEILEKTNSLHVVAHQGGYHYFTNEQGAVACLSEAADYPQLQEALLALTLQHHNPIAWHFLTEHLYINKQLGTLYDFAARLSVIQILSAPIKWVKKKELIKYKLKGIIGQKRLPAPTN